MGVVARLAVYLVAISWSLPINSAFASSPLSATHNFNPTSILTTGTPLDPLRSTCMEMASDVAQVRRSQRSLDDSVLKYLTKMVGICRRLRHREMRWYYEEAWEVAATKIYGPLPPRPEYNLAGLEISPSSGQHPQDVITRFPEGWTTRPRTMPLRKIVKRFTRPWKNDVHTYETLECAHVLMAPAGYSVPVKSRRCPHCAIATMLAKKKPASVITPARRKAVTA